MDGDQPTLADILAHPLVTVLCASAVAAVGWLLSRQVTAIETAIKEHEMRLDRLDWKMWKVMNHLWPEKDQKPSPFTVVPPPREGSA